jgi:hypothetical protein
MEQSRDSSVWRSLAVAFGDGLAFGVGMTLTQKAGRRPAAPESVAAAPPPGRIEELERRVEQYENTPARLDPKALEAVVRAVEGQLRERDAQWAERLNGAIEAVRHEAEEEITALRKNSLELAAALRRDVVEDLRTLEAQGVALHQEIADAVPRIVEEQLPARLEVRAKEMEACLREEMARAAALASEALDSVIDGKLGLLRGELKRKDREIAELRERLAAGGRVTRDLLAEIARICREATEQMEAPPQEYSGEVAPPEPPSEPPASESPSGLPPRFDVTPGRSWSLPLVSSLLVASGCLFWLHWL